MNLLTIDFSNKSERAPKQWMATVVFSMVILTLWVISLLAGGFNLALYFIAMTLVVGLIFVTPTAGLPVMILATMWYQRWFTLEPIVFGDVILKLYPIDVVFGATMVGLAFHQLFGKKKLRLPLEKIDGILIVFMGLCFVYLVRGYVDGLSDTALSVSAFKNYAFYGLLYFLVTLTVQRLEELKRVLKVLLVGGLGLLFFVFAGILRGQGLWTEYNPLSTEGVRLLSFPHAYYLSTVLIISLVLLIYRLRPERTTLLIMWMQFVGVLGSLMRHLWLALFTATLFLLFVLPKKAKQLLVKFLAKNTVLVCFLTIVIGFFFIVFPLSPATDRLQDITDPLYSRAQSLARSTADSSARWRFFAWRAARESIVEYPIWGVGYGKELIIEFETYRVVVPMRELHNSLLVLFVQMGAVGLLVFLYLVWRLTVRVYWSFRVRGVFFPYQLAFLSALLVFIASSFTQPYFETNFTGVFFWILMGLLVVSLRLDDHEAERLALLK